MSTGQILDLIQSGDLTPDDFIAVREAAIGGLVAATAVATDPLPVGAIKRLPLPSGSVAVFYRRKGRALSMAQRAAGEDTSRMAFALLAQMVEIDGRQPLMEDLEDMDLLDVLKLQEEFGNLGKASAGPTAKP